MTESTAPAGDARTRLLDGAGAAEVLGVPATWVMAQARADRIPHVRFGKYVRFDPEALDEWWRSQMRGLSG